MERHLNEIAEFLKNNPAELSSTNDDGRVNSISNEDEIIEQIKNQFSSILDKPAIREWYDFSLITPKKIYVNVKVSDLSNNAADNLSSKLGMGYALTGNTKMPIRWDQFNNMVAEKLKIGYDYYFLIVNKTNPSDVFWTSLKRIKTLVPNGNNLPFQCDWNKNRSFSDRTEIESMRYILEQYVNSWDKKTKGYPHKIRELLINDKLLNE
jgi:hypothetical protein